MIVSQECVYFELGWVTDARIWRGSLAGERDVLFTRLLG